MAKDYQEKRGKMSGPDSGVSRNLVIFFAIVAVVVSVGGTWLVLSNVALQGNSPPEANIVSQQDFTQPPQPAPAESNYIPGTLTSAKVVLDIQPPR